MGTTKNNLLALRGALSAIFFSLYAFYFLSTLRAFEISYFCILMKGGAYVSSWFYNFQNNRNSTQKTILRVMNKLT